MHEFGTGLATLLLAFGLTGAFLLAAPVHMTQTSSPLLPRYCLERPLEILP